MGHSLYDLGQACSPAWNAGRKLGAKRPLHPKQVWAIRFWLEQEHRLRDRALFDLAIDSKLRGCDLVKIRIGELVSGARIRQRAIVIQQKTGKPVQFELLEPARTRLFEWLERRGGSLNDFVFPSRTDHADHISTPQYARLVDEWVTAIGLRREDYGTLFTAYQGSPDLQADGQPKSRANTAGSHQDRDYSQVLGRGGRRCPRLG